MPRFDLLARGPLSQGADAKATLLYPTVATEAKEARLRISDPVYGEQRAVVIVRPVNLVRLEALISGPETWETRRARRSSVEHLAFGE